MKFLLEEDLCLHLDKKHLIELAGNRWDFVDIVENRALSIVSEALSSKYDMGYELRAYVPYLHSVEYPSLQRLKLSYTQANAAWQATYPTVYLADYDYHGDTGNTEYSRIITVKNNTIEPEHTTEYRDRALSYSQSSRLQPNSSFASTAKNPLYNEFAGRVYYGPLTDYIATSKINNYHNTIYTPPAEGEEIGTITPIDWTTVLDAPTAEGLLYSQATYDQLTAEQYTQDDRNQTLIQIVSSFVTYYLVQSCAPRMLSETIKYNYDEAQKRLQGIATGKIQTNLKLLPTTSPLLRGAGIRFGKSITQTIEY